MLFLLPLLLAAADTTPGEWLKQQTPPVFRAGQALPPLTRYGWVLPMDARIELAERWGYCLEFSGYVTPQVVDKALGDPKSDEAKCVELAAKDPRRYPLAVICSRELPTTGPPEMWTRDAQGKFLSAEAKSYDGTVWDAKMRTVYSPEAPDDIWRQAGEFRAAPLRRLREKCPIAIVLNGGEYGLGVSGFARKVWELDPAVVKAKGQRTWFDYISERKGRAETLIADAVRAAVPDRQLYIYYTAGGGTHRNRWGGWAEWEYGYEWMKPVSDLPTAEFYYRHFNSGFTGDMDLLTFVLNAKGREIAAGRPLSFSWVCAGWPRGKDEAVDLADIERWSGFLSCLYAAGTVTANAGYYAYPKGGFAVKFPADQPPHWLRQMVATARVHARFSHLEAWLRQGDLLPGPDKHRWSKDQPAYQFPTGDKTAHVLVRKLRDRPEWLLCAWTADGPDRDVTVTVPELGPVPVRATAGAGVYRAVVKDGKAVVTAL